jgi:dTMP kinase
MGKGKLIVIDGIDGSGKQTQTKILVEKLNKKNIQTETLDFPQYTQNFFGKMVRRYLNGEFGNPTKVNPHLASILYAADRFESSKKIKQWLDEGKVVILDRYHTSNLIHQGTKFSKQEIDEYIKWDEIMEFEVFKIPKPDLVIYLHIPAKVAYDLITKRGDGHDGLDTIEHMESAEKMCGYLADKLSWETVECAENNELSSIEKISEKIENIIVPVVDKE